MQRKTGGFLQHVETKQVPLHGLLQTKTDLRFATEGGFFFKIMLLLGEGGNITEILRRLNAVDQ